MDKAVIVGVYEFIGYQLCESLLEEGIEVFGIHLPTGTSEAIVEEKRLLVGRNSNFYERDDTFLTNLEQLEKDTFIFFDYYSFYMDRQEEMFIEKVQSCLQKRENTAVILPVQKLGVGHDSIKSLFQCEYRFFLPSIYGPWQPSIYFFCKALTEPNEEHTIESREWVEDTLFVEDAVQSILKGIEEQKSNSILLKSNIENHWQKIASELGQQTPSIDQQRNVEMKDDIETFEVKGIPYKDGIERQKRFIRLNRQ